MTTRGTVKEGAGRKAEGRPAGRGGGRWGRWIVWLPVIWLAAAAARLAAWPLAGLKPPALEFFYLSLTLAASAVCFFAFWSDKRRAARGDLRIAERTLLALALLGGWAGGILAARLFRHKTQKTAFRLQMAAITLAHLALIGVVVWSWVT
jgi:uncharacterized membrane protein YsdA (DUF1294 family)